MKAIILTKYGSPDLLQVKEVETPLPKENEVLIKIHSASINDWDWGLVRGKPFYIRLLCGMTRPKINIPGADISGRIESVGKAVKKLQVGDDVYGDISECGFGGFAEYVCVPENELALKPAKMSHEEAAAIPHAAMLAVQGLHDRGELREGQKLLINGAGGGVGTMGVQIAKSVGAEVTGVDSAEKAEMMRSLGFDHTIDYKSEDFTKNGQQYDLILDTKTNRSVFDYARALKPGGIYATVGGTTPRLIEALLLAPIIRRLRKKFIRIVALKPNKDLEYINELFEAGKIKPVIDGPYKLRDVPEAIQYFGEGKHKGKVIITIGRNLEMEAKR